jgi:hypothetical protein
MSYRFSISGTDSDGDRHSLETNDPYRAEATLSQFLEDLNDVTFVDRNAGAT